MRSVSETTSKPAKLLPKEHGAYAILAVPIVAAMIVVPPTVVGVCIAIATSVLQRSCNMVFYAVNLNCFARIFSSLILFS